MGGDNDIMLTGCADQAKSAMMAMIHQCAARGVKPVVGIQFPVLGIPEPWRAVCDWERAQAESAAYIAWLRRLVRAVSLRHVDFAEAFERCGGRALYQADGMHPNARGQPRHGRCRPARAALPALSGRTLLQCGGEYDTIRSNRISGQRGPGGSPAAEWGESPRERVTVKPV